MPAAYRSHSSTTYASRTNTTINKPSGLATGDKLLLMQFVGAGGTAPAVTLPAGFTRMGSNPATSVSDSGSFNGRTHWAYKDITDGGSEPASYTVTHTSASSQGVLIAVSGGAAGAPQLTTNSGSSTISTALGLTTSGNDAMIVFATHNWNLYAPGAVPPTGTTPTFTERLDGATTLIYVATGVLATAGATGDKTHNNTNPDNTYPFAAFLAAVEAAGGAGSAGGLLMRRRREAA